MKKLMLVSMIILFPSSLLAQTPRLDRLTKLADYLDKEVPPKKFNIQNWGNTTNPDDPNYVGCAGGWSTKLFAKEGIHYERNHETNAPFYRGKSGTDAMMEFFGLSFLETEFLFSNKGKASDNPHKAASNIRMIVNKYRVMEYQQLTLIARF